MENCCVLKPEPCHSAALNRNKWDGREVWRTSRYVFTTAGAILIWQVFRHKATFYWNPTCLWSSGSWQCATATNRNELLCSLSAVLKYSSEINPCPPVRSRCCRCFTTIKCVLCWQNDNTLLVKHVQQKVQCVELVYWKLIFAFNSPNVF